MKKYFAIGLVAVTMAAFSAIGADVVTKYTIPTMVQEINTGFAAIDATGVTNVTKSTAAITASASVATWTTNVITYLDDTTNAVSSTNIIPATLSVTITNGASVVTNITVIRK
jgi:hypothetical protein